MTALAGFLGPSGRADNGDRCAAMLAAQARYAPAEPVQHRGDGIALGRRLFPTLPEDAYDTGPIREGPLLLLADLRLDNRAALIAELGIAPDQARSLCDSAIAMRAFVKWRDEAIGRLIGDFAIALWNADTRQLLLARDFMGQRPLHYHRGNGFFAFASMPSGLHALAEIPRRPDLSSLVRFLERAPPTANGRFFEAIERVEPGHVLTVTPDGIASRRYWNPSRTGPAFRTATDAQEAFRERLDEAVSARLRGAGNRVGAHLSGGLDSAAVATSAARLLAPMAGDVLAFTAVPGGPDISHYGRLDDEGPLAASTAALYPNITHIPVVAPRASPLDFLDRDLCLNEQIVTNICNNVWVGAINDAARERGLSVLLTGSMGNLSFSYSGQEALSHLFLRGQWRRLARITAALRRQKRGWPGLMKQTLEPFLPIGHRRAQPGLTLSSVSKPARAEAAHVTRPSADAFAIRLQALQRVDIGNFGKGMLAGWGLDIRDPTADRRLVEFALALPVEHFLAGGMPRGLARQGLADRLPRAVLEEHRRGYQGAGWHEGLNDSRSQLLDEVAAIARCPEATAILDMPRLQALVAEWPASWEDPATESLYRARLLPAIAAGHFIRSTS
jgi:asparagine synthase (glutamine-hydrolysing)